MGKEFAGTADCSVARTRRKMLPSFMVPSAMIALETLPLTANGKLARYSLPAPVDGTIGSAAYEAPEGAVETTLARIWQDLLQVEQVGRGNNFFELGGHSMSAMKLIVRVAEQFSIQLHVQTVFRCPDFKDMSQTIGARLSGDPFQLANS